MIPPEFQKRLDDYIFPEEGGDLSIKQVDFISETPKISVLLNCMSYEENFKEIWEISIIGHRTSKISLEQGHSFEILNGDDPLLWEFKEKKYDIYLSNPTKHPANLFLELYYIHIDTYGEYINFEKYFNKNLTSIGSVQLQHGHFATAPEPLIKMYGECLTKYGIQYSIINEQPPTKYVNHAQVPENPDIKLLKLAQSFIIADDFMFRKLN